MYIDQATQAELEQWQAQLSAQYDEYVSQGLNLDLTRGKPSTQQLGLSNELDGILAGNYQSTDGTDTRNYGGLDGIAEMKTLGAEMLGVRQDEILAGGNASLTLMHQAVHYAYLFGTHEGAAAWKDEGQVKFLCPVPGYDRHFAICEDLGIEMIKVAMTEHGPDMDQVEQLIQSDPAIRGIWCVPKYSNPTGITYSDETVDRIARLGKIAAANFRVFWDNAYAIHDLRDTTDPLANVMDRCRAHGTEDSVLQFASTSKISFAGAGVAFLAASAKNLSKFKKHLGICSIGPDKVNQLRHAKMFPNLDALKAHMEKHRALLEPKFDAVIEQLESDLRESDMGSWQIPNGGYFVSFDTRPGLANEVVKLAASAGVKLTPAGATFPYGKDPDNCNIRLAPSLPVLADVRTTMKIFVLCVKLASVRQRLAELG